MKKILFTHSYFLHLDPKQLATKQPYPPLGTLYAAAVMREQGYEVTLFDTMFQENTTAISSRIDSYEPDIVVIYDDGFNYLTKMCLTNMREAAFVMSKIARTYGCTVIVSSSDASDRYEAYLNEGADYILIGEAEQTLLELIGSFTNNQLNRQEIQGIAFKEANGSIVKTVSRKVMADLDSLPFPAWDLIDIAPYREMWLKSSGYFSLNIGTTRGCPFKCNWCAKPIYGNRYHSRSPEKVVAELVLLKGLHGFDHIWFCDDIFGLKPGWVASFAQLVTEADLKFTFKIQARADLLVQENYIKALAKAGCTNVWMGAESGSQKILDAMDKGITIEQVIEATRLLKQYGIMPSWFIQFGYPGEDWEDIRLTISMIKQWLPHSIGISVSYPLPGTLFYEKVKNDLAEKSNWTDSDELKMMFRNRFQPEFYKQLHRYVHCVYRKKLAFTEIRYLLLHPLSLNRLSLKKSLSALYYLPAALISSFKTRQLAKIPKYDAAVI
ncbi:MAG: hypothetical protein RLZZ28_1829 [Bacteroidota bacterium]